MAKEIFISYSRKDFDKVKAIKDEIDRELGIDCWMDLDGIESGDLFKKVIIKAINEHDTFLFMLSANSMASPYALKELSFAASKHKRVILVFIEPCQMIDDFLFDYQDYDNIDWNNPLQHNKLMGNLHKWFPNSTRRENTIPESAEEGSVEAQYHKGCEYYSEGDFLEASKWFLKAANQGHVLSQFRLGWFYENGKGVKQDYIQAVYWYKKAAEQGYANAQNNLGICYENGKGVQQDYTQAAYWYKKAAEQGDADAQCNLGYCYDEGHGVKQDYTQAVYWYRKAAEQGYAAAQSFLGYCYDAGNGVEQNYTSAVYWYLKAAEQGEVSAQYSLGICYKNGEGVTQDYAQAVYWFQKAAEQGEARAQRKLAVCFENGNGVKQNFAQAVYWYRKAAEQGDTIAIKWLKARNINY